MRRQVFHFLPDASGTLACDQPVRGDQVVTLRAAPDVPFRVADLF